MVEVAAHGEVGFTRCCQLHGPGGLVDNYGSGDLELHLAWRFDAEYAMSLRQLLPMSTGLLKLNRKMQDPKSTAQDLNDSKHAWMVEEEAFAPNIFSSKNQEKLTERRQEVVFLAGRHLDKIQENKTTMISGSYQVQVHIIECRDLKSDHLSGLASPYIHIKVMGRSKKTRVIRKVSSCVFDDTLYFNFTGLMRSAIEEASIEVRVHDFNAFWAHKLIGMVVFDARTVYSLPNHEMYRKWVGVMNDKSRNNRYHGFIKLSVTVLGPGDEQATHDLDLEYQKELAEENIYGDKYSGGLAPTGPNIEMKTYFLVVFVWEANEITIKEAGFFASAGIEAYVKVVYAGLHAVTSVVCVQGRESLSPEFSEELWLPMAEPTEAKRISVGLWDYNALARDRPISHLYFDVDDIKRAADTCEDYFLGGIFRRTRYLGPSPSWHNLYGAPAGIQGKRGALQNRYGEEASTYRGRLLLSMEILFDSSNKTPQAVRRKAFHFKPNAGLTPITAKYHLRAFAIMGSELPQFWLPGIRNSAKMRLVISIGNHKLYYAWQPNKQGTINWNTIQTLKAIKLPVLVREIPDVCVYLMCGPPKVQTTCFCRIPAAKLLKEQFRGGPHWEMLKLEPSMPYYPTSPGAVLLQLGFGLSEDAVDPEFCWPEDILLKKSEELVPFCLRVHVFQAKNLPASDDNGLLDPYIKVRFCGRKETTRTHSMTTAPLFYETLEFHEMLPLDVRFGPDIIVQVWDKDTFSSDTPRASLRVPLVACPILCSEGSAPPSPSWLKLTNMSSEPLGSELLMSAGLIRKRDLREKLSHPENIIPAMKQAWVEVTCIGVRQLKASMLRVPQVPYLRIDIPAPNNQNSWFKTKPSSEPEGRNANFLERSIIAIEMPEKAMYAQQMDLRVYDAHIGLSTGLKKPLLGSCSIELAKKMPWNAGGFIPPQMELFGDTDTWRQAEESEEESDLRTRAELAREDLAVDSRRHNAVAESEFHETADRKKQNAYDEFEGDYVEQCELERFAEQAAGCVRQDDAGYGDAGYGAFDQSVLSNLPMIHEDLAFAREPTRKEQQSHYNNIVSHVSNPVGASYKLSDLPISFPSQWAAADYIKGREWWTEKCRGKELEGYLKTKPFESYKIFRGKYDQNASKSTLRCVGIIKLIIRVLDVNPAFEEKPFFPMKTLLPAPYTVRLYIIRGFNLQPLNGNLANPYLRVKLASCVEDRKNSHHQRTSKPQFYDFFEFHTSLPGLSMLKIQVKEWTKFYPVHEVLGQTEIDLEDRWFHKDWQKLGTVRESVTSKLKPIEKRSLYKDTSSVVQGLLDLWLDIRPESEVHRDPPVTFRGPEKHKFEVRIICWKSKDVPFEMGDYFSEFWIGGSRKQKTDIHWRCRNGQASWNWRIKIPMELPFDSPEKGRLVVQLWDQDIIKWNEVVGETQVDLYQWFLKAYHEKRALSVYTEINQAISLMTDQGPSISNRASTKPQMKSGSTTQGNTRQSQIHMDIINEKTTPLDKSGTLDHLGSTTLSGPYGSSAEKDAAYFVKQLKEFVGLGDIDQSAQWIKLTYHDRRANRVVYRGSLAISIEIIPKEEVELRPAGHGRTDPNANPYLPPTTGRVILPHNPLALCSALIGPKLAFQILCCSCCILIMVLVGLCGIYLTSIFTVLQSFGLATMPS
jgi:hypothetical protein